MGQDENDKWLSSSFHDLFSILALINDDELRRKIKIWVNSHLTTQKNIGKLEKNCKYLSLFFLISQVTLFPFLYLREKKNPGDDVGVQFPDNHYHVFIFIFYGFWHLVGFQ